MQRKRREHEKNFASVFLLNCKREDNQFHAVGNRKIVTNKTHTVAMNF
jgi:hypothetical protein